MGKQSDPWHHGDYSPFKFATSTKKNITLIIRHRYHNRRDWYQRKDLNLRPPTYEAGVLTN